MDDVWMEIYSGEVEGRNVTLSRYSSGELLVKTTQKITEVTEASSDGSNHILPTIIPEGSTINVEAETVEELKIELQKVEFSIQAAQQIVSHLDGFGFSLPMTE